MKSVFHFAQALGLFLVAYTCTAAENTQDAQPKLPDPLTLEYALSLADEGHPDLLLSQSRLDASKATRDSIASEKGLSVKLDAGAFVTDEDRLQSLPAQDHIRAGVIVSKELYDFGYTDTRLQSAEELINAQQLQFLETRARRRISILKAYTDVLLADLQFNQYNEAMAVGYVNFDKAQKRRSLGKLSDLEVLQFESEYQRLRVLRYKSDNLQRTTRAKLAETLNRPNQLPDRIAQPKLEVISRKLPEYEELQGQAMSNNLRIKALQHQLQAAQSALIAARNSDNPVINFNARAHEYEVEAGAADEFSAELVLRYDLYKPDKGAKVAAKLADLYAARAQLSKGESELRQSVLELWHEIEELNVNRQSLAKLLELSELRLEQSRALYEMEVKADLGYSMVELTAAQYQSAQNKYRLALAWYKLDLLTGNMNLQDSTQTPPPNDSEFKAK